jgi:hypothetical protein
MLKLRRLARPARKGVWIGAGAIAAGAVVFALWPRGEPDEVVPIAAPKPVTTGDHPHLFHLSRVPTGLDTATTTAKGEIGEGRPRLEPVTETVPAPVADPPPRPRVEEKRPTPRPARTATATPPKTLAAPPPPIEQPAPPPAPPPAPTALDTRPGTLVIQVFPWADIWVDGVHRGSKDATVQVAPGPHRIVLRHPTLGQKEEEVDVKPGARVERRIQMSR